MKDSEVVLCPVVEYPDPFRRSCDGKLILCETELPNGYPHPDNTRRSCHNYLTKYEAEQPMYGFEQEFFVIDCHTLSPVIYKTMYTKSSKKDLNYNDNLDYELDQEKTMLTKGPESPDIFYCSVGAHLIAHRDLMYRVLGACLSSTINAIITFI